MSGGVAQPQEIDNIDLNLYCRYVKEVTMNPKRAGKVAINASAPDVLIGKMEPTVCLCYSAG